MGVGETGIVYLTLGAVVAGAMWLRKQDTQVGAWSVVLWWLFWPLFAPTLLASSAPMGGEQDPAQVGVHRALQARLAKAKAALEGELAKLDGLAAGVIQRERERVIELQVALESMITRVEELDATLERPEFDEVAAQELLRLAREQSADEVELQLLGARLRNIGELKQLRYRTLTELERAVLRMEEMSTRVAVLRFVEGPKKEAQLLIDEISVAIDDITEGIVAIS